MLTYLDFEDANSQHEQIKFVFIDSSYTISGAGVFKI